MRPLLSRAMAELYGTAALILFGSAAVYMGAFPGSNYGVMGIALIHGVILSVAVSATMGISGGLLNPALTIGMAVVRRISLKDAAVYIAAQLVGAILAAIVVRTCFAPNVGYLKAFGAPMLGTGITLGQGITIEAILTFFLMSSLMGTAVAKSAPKIGGFGIGLTLIPLIMIGGPLTGAAVNPARAFGPALVNGMMTAQAVYWIGPILGAVVAAFLWQYVILKDE